jgi:hypothetical protein
MSAACRAAADRHASFSSDFILMGYLPFPQGNVFLVVLQTFPDSGDPSR